MSAPLGERARSAVLWNTGFNLFGDGLQFLVMLILVRLLAPEAYGQFGLATSIIGFMVALLSFNNFVAHTLQPRDDAEVDYQLHFTAGAAFQITGFLVANLVAVVVRAVPAYAETAPLVHAMSFTFLLTWPHELRVKMLERAMDWRRLRLLQALGLLMSASLSILMALGGAGAYALAVPGMLLGTAPFIYDLFVRQRWRPDWRWDRRRYMPAFRFGLALMPNYLMATSRPLLEQSLIVHAFGYASAGLLTRAVSLATMLCLGPASQLVAAIYPVMTRVEPGTERYRRMGALLLRVVAWTAVPVAALFAFIAEPVVALVYGDQWLGVVPLLPLAMLAGALGALKLTLGRLLLALNQLRAHLIGDILWLLGIGASLMLLLPLGLAAYVGGLCAVEAVLTLFLIERVRRVGGLDLAGLGLAVGPAVIAIVLAVVTTWQGFVILAMDKDTIAGATLFGFVASMLYLAALRLLFPRHLDEILAYLPGVHTMRRFLLLTQSPKAKEAIASRHYPDLPVSTNRGDDN